MDQHQVLRDATSPVLRLLRRLCAAAPGGDEFVALLWRIWLWLRALRQGVAPATVGVTLPLDGCNQAALGVDDDDDGGDSSFNFKNRVTDHDDGAAGAKKLTDDDDDGKKESALGTEHSTPATGPAAGAKNLTDDDDVGKKESALSIEQSTPATGRAAAIKDNAAGKNNPAPPARPVRHPGRAIRRPPQAVRPASATPVLDDLQEDESFFDREVDVCRAMHEGYAAACSSLKKKKTYCLECFIRHEKNPAKERPPVPINNEEEVVLKHMRHHHKMCGSDWSKCKRHGCLAMTVTPQDMGHHQLHAHRM